MIKPDSQDRTQSVPFIKDRSEKEALVKRPKTSPAVGVYENVGDTRYDGKKGNNNNDNKDCLFLASGVLKGLNQNENHRRNLGSESLSQNMHLIYQKSSSSQVMGIYKKHNRNNQNKDLCSYVEMQRLNSVSESKNAKGRILKQRTNRFQRLNSSCDSLDVSDETLIKCKTRSRTFSNISVESQHGCDNPGYLNTSGNCDFLQLEGDNRRSADGAGGDFCNAMQVEDCDLPVKKVRRYESKFSDDFMPENGENYCDTLNGLSNAQQRYSSKKTMSFESVSSWNDALEQNCDRSLGCKMEANSLHSIGHSSTDGLLPVANGQYELNNGFGWRRSCHNSDDLKLVDIEDSEFDQLFSEDVHTLVQNSPVFRKNVGNLNHEGTCHVLANQIEDDIFSNESEALDSSNCYLIGSDELNENQSSLRDNVSKYLAKGLENFPGNDKKFSSMEVRSAWEKIINDEAIEMEDFSIKEMLRETNFEKTHDNFLPCNKSTSTPRHQEIVSSVSYANPEYDDPFEAEISDSKLSSCPRFKQPTHYAMIVLGGKEANGKNFVSKPLTMWKLEIKISK
jgi:hypothetical protein